MDLEVEAGVGARPQALHAHCLQLAVQHLDALTVRAQGELVGPHVRAHVVFMQRHQADPGVGQDRRLVVARVIVLQL